MSLLRAMNRPAILSLVDRRGTTHHAVIRSLDAVLTQVCQFLAQRGEADLTLAADRLTGQLQLYQQMAVLMSDHPGLDARAPRDLLLEAADKTAALDVMLVDGQGRVVSAANGTDSPDLSRRAFFRRRSLHSISRL